MNVFKYGPLALALTLVIAPPAYAAVCGDDVDGRRVPCECGDVVVSDTELRIDDPIAMRRCETDGLIVRSAADAESIRVELNGLSLQGSGAGTGIKVVRGGRLGATILGSRSDGAAAQVIGFRTGVSARGKSTLAHISDVVIDSNSKTGITVDTDGATIVNVSTSGNAGDGARLGGRGVNASGLNAHRNSGVGIVIRERKHDVHGKAGQNGAAGVTERGYGHTNSVEVSQ